MNSTGCRRFLGLSGLVCLCFAVGCGEQANEMNANVQGAVTIDGQLADRGTVALHPVDGGPTAYGSIGKDGTFALRIGQGNLNNPNSSQIYAGEYVATVVVKAPSTLDDELGESAPPIPGVRLTAAKYSNKATSNLVYTIKPGGNVIDISLEATDEQESLDSAEDLGATEGAESEDLSEQPPETANEADASQEEPTR